MLQLLRYHELKSFGVPFSKSHIYFLMSRNVFPRPIKLSANTVAWVREDIENWISEKITASRVDENIEIGDVA